MLCNDFHVIIPARLASVRLPRKMLLEIAGIPLIIRVAMIAKASTAKTVVVATDHSEIARLCTQHHVDYIITSDQCQSGSERVAAAAELLALPENDPIINLQGDEPFMQSRAINELAQHMLTTRSQMATVAATISNLEEILNPNIVKVVINEQHQALYFSRAAIPYQRDNSSLDKTLITQYWRHLGIYAYSRQFLRTYLKLSQCSLEEIEKLEQLRVLYHGYNIDVITLYQSVIGGGIDTPADLAEAQSLFMNHVDLQLESRD